MSDYTVLEIFNRTNTVIQTLTSRASLHYDSDHPYQYHITEIADPRIYYDFFNVGYRGKPHAKIASMLHDGSRVVTRYDQQLQYGTDKKMDDEAKVMVYCNIDEFWVLDAQGDWTYDANGYLIVN